MDLLSYLEASGVKTIGHGPVRKALCPLHRDSRPSFAVYLKDDSWYCYGCGEHGDLYALVMRLEKMTFPEAKRFLGDYQPRQRVIPMVQQEPLNHEVKIRLTVAALEYHRLAEGNAKARAYLEERGISDVTFYRQRIGWCSDTVEDPLDPLGDGERPLLANRVVIPEFDGTGACLYMQGRTLNGGQPPYLGLHLPKPLYGYERFQEERRLYLVEGPFDWLTLLQWKLPAICALGCNLSRYQVALLVNKEVVLCQDNDAAGDKAADELAKVLPRSRRLRPPLKDWNLWLQRGATAEDFCRLDATK